MLHLKVDRFWAQSQVPKSITLIFFCLRNRSRFRPFSAIMYARTRFVRFLTSAVFVDSGSQSATFRRPNPCCFRHNKCFPLKFQNFLIQPLPSSMLRNMNHLTRKRQICENEGISLQFWYIQSSLPADGSDFLLPTMLRQYAAINYCCYSLAQRCWKRRPPPINVEDSVRTRRFHHRCASGKSTLKGGRVTFLARDRG